jgi:hypothetical protein
MAVQCSAVRCSGPWCCTCTCACTAPARERRTGCVSELILLPFYPVLQGLGVAPCDLNFLLDGLLVHVGHATLELPGGEGGVSRRARERKRRGRQIQGASRRERSWGHRGDGGQRQRSVGGEAAMATGARGAAAIACAGRRWGGGRRVWWWRVQRTEDEVRYADGRLASPRDTRTDTRWDQRKSCWLPGYGNNAICCAADEQMRG